MEVERDEKDPVSDWDAPCAYGSERTTARVPESLPSLPATSNTQEPSRPSSSRPSVPLRHFRGTNRVFSDGTRLAQLNMSDLRVPGCRDVTLLPLKPGARDYFRYRLDSPRQFRTDLSTIHPLVHTMRNTF